MNDERGLCVKKFVQVVLSWNCFNRKETQRKNTQRTQSTKRLPAFPAKNKQRHKFNKIKNFNNESYKKTTHRYSAKRTDRYT